MIKLMQKAVNTANKWAKDCGLTLSPEKTVAVLFSRKRQNPPQSDLTLTLEGHELKFVDKVKYLGITLDSRLSFKEHVNERIKKAKTYLFTLRSSIGKTWGPDPEQILWIWNMVVKPMVTYGSLVWATSLNKTLRNKLNKLQRLALMQCGHFRKSTPETGLDVILGEIPLDLTILAEAMISRIRTKDKIEPNWNGKGKGKNESHFRKLDNMLPLHLKEVIIDAQNGNPAEASHFIINHESLRHGNDINEGLRMYTDGSRINQRGGYGAVLLDGQNSITHATNGEISQHGTVFQAECTAMIEAAKVISEQYEHECIYSQTTKLW